jgi:hypothetical protein
MRADFKTAKKTLRTSNSGLHIVAVNGCCYGRDNKPDIGLSRTSYGMAKNNLED